MTVRVSAEWANVGYRGLQTLLAIIDRLSRQPEAEPVGYRTNFAPTRSRFVERRRMDVAGAVPVGSLMLHTSPRLDREGGGHLGMRWPEASI